MLYKRKSNGKAKLNFLMTKCCFRKGCGYAWFEIDGAKREAEPYQTWKANREKAEVRPMYKIDSRKDNG